MKILLYITSIICLSSCKTVSPELSVQFLFPEHFEKAMVIEAIIVEKPNTYYAQNLVDLPFYLKLEKVNGKKFDQELIVEFSTERKVNFKLGSIQKLHVYERLKEIGTPAINGEIVQIPLQCRSVLEEVYQKPDPNDPFNRN